MTTLCPDAKVDTAIRIFSASEDPTAAEQFAITMGKAFADEPGNDFYCGVPEQYEERWRLIAKNLLLRNWRERVLYCAGPEYGAAMMAYVYPDEKVPDSAPEPPGITDLSRYTRPETVPIRERMFAFMTDGKAAFHQTHGSFHYIAFLATRPELRGKGYGSLLLRLITEKADAAGRWCYLEATSEANVRLYERHGFFKVGEPFVGTLASLPGTAATLIPMAREPMTRGATQAADASAAAASE